MIGVFDSGFGGLTILKSFLEHLPQYDYLYLGDNARTPYGNRSPELIYQFTREAVDFLFGQGCQLILIACFTASAEALQQIQQEYLPEKNQRDKKLQRRILGVIRPLVEEAIRFNNFKKIGVIGTCGTINSQTFIRELKKINPNLEIHQKECPLLVPLIEEGYYLRREAKMILRNYLRQLKLKKIDTLILGCTHYPIMLKQIRQVIGKSCRILNPGEIVAKSLVEYLTRHPEIESQLSRNSQVRFFTTDNPEKFKIFGSKFLGQKIDKVEKMNLSN
jgi:glutamate racemase